MEGRLSEPACQDARYCRLWSICKSIFRASFLKWESKCVSTRSTRGDGLRHEEIIKEIM